MLSNYLLKIAHLSRPALDALRPRRNTVVLRNEFCLAGLSASGPRFNPKRPSGQLWPIMVTILRAHSLKGMGLLAIWIRTFASITEAQHA
jgi:hypothetical protein